MRLVRAVLWFGAYLALILFPLAVAAVFPGEGAVRPLTLQIGVACGFVGLSVLAFQYALVAKVETLAAAYGQDALLRFHKWMGIAAAWLLAIHATLVMSGGYPLEWLNPFDSATPSAMRWGVITTALLVLLMASSLLRRQFRLPFDWWQLIHTWLADLILLGALAHVLQFGVFSATIPMRATLAAYYCILLVLGVYYKLVRPMSMWNRRWRVVENRHERGDCHTLVLVPVGHAGFTFEPGQYAWLNTGRTPFHRDRHPISFSSCAYDEAGRPVEFSIRKLGDWSGSVVPKLKPGDSVWVDGPYGVFSSDREQGMGYVLVAGGIGIAPMKSICATMAERADTRPVILFFLSRDLDGLTFHEALEQLTRRMNLKVIYVLEHPPTGWTGESGVVTKELLAKHLPRHYRRFQYFVCGPVPMMDCVEKILPQLGVPADQIHSERFEIV